MRRRRKQHLFVLRALQGERAGRLSIACVIGEQLRRDARHDQRLTAQQGPGEWPHGKHLFPYHRSVVAIVSAQDVVERDEVHPLRVEHRQSEQIGAGGPAPIGVGVVSAERMELIVPGADEDAIADRQDAGGRLGKLVRPDFIAGLERERDNAAVLERKVHAVPGRSGRRAQRRSEILLPEDLAVDGANRQERARLGLGEQPSGVPMQRDDSAGNGTAPCGAAVGFRSRLDKSVAAGVHESRAGGRWRSSSGIRPTTPCCRP